MLTSFAIFAGSIGGGFVQTVTGFGTAIVLMAFLPYFFNVIDAAAISAAVCIATNTLLIWKYRHSIALKKALLPLISYVAVSVYTIAHLSALKMDILEKFFGIFLIAISLYFLLGAENASIHPKWYAAVICGSISGFFSALFGIGGPLIALYFASTTDDRSKFLGCSQFVFFVSAFFNLWARITNGIYRSDMLGMILLGFAGVLIGSRMGNMLCKRIDATKFRKIVYLFVGVSGMITVIQPLVE